MSTATSPKWKASRRACSIVGFVVVQVRTVRVCAGNNDKEIIEKKKKKKSSMKLHSPEIHIMH